MKRMAWGTRVQVVLLGREDVGPTQVEECEWIGTRGYLPTVGPHGVPKRLAGRTREAPLPAPPVPPPRFLLFSLVAPRP